MKYEIDESKIEKFQEDFFYLEKLLTRRISGLYKIEGMEQARHAYIYYRKLLWDLRDTIIENIKEIK